MKTPVAPARQRAKKTEDDPCANVEDVLKITRRLRKLFWNMPIEELEAKAAQLRNNKCTTPGAPERTEEEKRILQHCPDEARLRTLPKLVKSKELEIVEKYLCKTEAGIRYYPGKNRGIILKVVEILLNGAVIPHLENKPRFNNEYEAMNEYNNGYSLDGANAIFEARQYDAYDAYDDDYDNDNADEIDADEYQDDFDVDRFCEPWTCKWERVEEEEIFFDQTLEEDEADRIYLGYQKNAS